MTHPTWNAFRSSLTEDERWSHCGNQYHHVAHPHDFAMNEGLYKNVHCVGTPAFHSAPSVPPPRPPRPDWDQYFIQLVDAAAQRATCDRGLSAAVFVRDNDVLATGYVGAPPGLPDCFEAGHLMQAVSTYDSEELEWVPTAHCIRTIHAEQNGILRAARNGVSLKHATVYCTMEPCANCAMSLISLNVHRVVAKNSYHGAQRTRDMFAAASVRLEVLSPEELYVT